MSLSSVLIVLAIAFLAYLVLYGAVFVVFTLAMLVLPEARRAGTRTRARGSVTVLIPSHHEGAALIDTVESLLTQDYEGLLRISVLVSDHDDSSVPHLEAAYLRGATPMREGLETILCRTETRVVTLVETGVGGKREKLNAQLPRVTSELTALLDADHRANPDWISSAVTRMEDEGFSVVQGRRRPLSTARLPQLWDSAQGHVGNEVVNTVLSQAHRSVAFTGTTAVFRTEVLFGRQFADCVTEDTYLSLDLILSGERIGYDPFSGSYEEVAPSLRSYVARRRRWSAGHTKSFVDHFRGIVAKKSPWGQKLHLLLYGQFFLLPVAICLAVLFPGLYLFLQLPAYMQIVTSMVALFCGAFLARLVSAGGRHWLNDSLVGVVWMFPQVTGLALLLYPYVGDETYYFILSVPFHEDLLPWQLGALVAPLFLLVVGWLRLGGLHPVQVLLLLVTYPLMLVLDVYACLLGATDFLFGRSHWSNISRDSTVMETAVPAALRRQLSASRKTRLSWGRMAFVAAGGLVIILTNDLLSVNDCGLVRPFLWKPLLWKWGAATRLHVEIRRQPAARDGWVDFEVRTTMTGPVGSRAHLRYSLDGKPAGERSVELAPDSDNTDALSLTFPMGWERHRVDVAATGAGFSCRRKRHGATSLVELREKRLFVNGEPFLVKAVIPSFSAPGLNLSLEEGLAQLKQRGANAIRLYHGANRAMREATTQARLLVVQQPDESTWSNVVLESPAQREGLLKRYEALIGRTDGFPYLLMDSLGNELELLNRSRAHLELVGEMIRQLEVTGRKRSPLSYSTFLTYADFPVDILGVNMLDSGETYWDKALRLLQSFNRPFYATELGGFVAFRERTPVDLRIVRLRSYWHRLLQAGALGACFFQSHDNWAQPVPPGYHNDPFRAEQPDDVRGFWDQANRPKLELSFLTELLSDLEVRSADRVLEPAANEVRLLVKNRRTFRLAAIEVSHAGRGVATLGDLAPGEEKVLRLGFPPAVRATMTSRLEIAFRYTTHRGLEGRSLAALNLPFATDRPVVLNPGFVEERSEVGAVNGRLLFGRELEVVVPPGWGALMVNGRRMDTIGSRLSIPLRTPYHEVTALSWSRDGQRFGPFEPNVIRGGKHFLRFRIPRLPGTTRILLLAGLGASSVRWGVVGGPKRSFATHSYRQNFIDLAKEPQNLEGRDVEIEVDRRLLRYVGRDLVPWREDIVVDLEAPMVFSPAAFELRRPEP